MAQAPGGPFDVVLNLVAGPPEAIAALTDLVADGGVLLSATTPPPETAERGVRTVHVQSHSDAGQLAELVSLVDAGELRIEVADRRPLGELAAVHDEAETGRLAGKTVLLPV